MITDTIGIDISKDHLDLHRLRDGANHQFVNSPQGLRALVDWLRKATVRLIAFEPTGPYHRALEEALAEAGLPAVKINPRHARRFAEATGTLAKTDRLDARLLARMAACLDLEPRSANSKALNDLKELHVARAALVRERTATINRAKALTLALLKRQNAQRLAQIERQIKAIEAEIAKTFADDPDLERRLDILNSIPGVANITAFAMLIDMPELGSLDEKQAASLAGLAPMTRQSGRWRGKAFIRGGRANLRQALYMPALVAARCNRDLKAKYDALVSRGKPRKIALVAIMRKLIILANALLRDGRKWMPKIA